MTVAGKCKFLIGKERGKKVERHPVTYVLRSTSVDSVDLDQRKILVTFPGRANLADDGVSRLKGITLNLILRHIDIIRRVKVIVVRGTEKSISVGHDLQDSLGLHYAVILRTGRLLRLLCWSRLPGCLGRLLNRLLRRILLVAVLILTFRLLLSLILRPWLGLLTHRLSLRCRLHVGCFRSIIRLSRIRLLLVLGLNPGAPASSVSCTLLLSFLHSLTCSRLLSGRRRFGRRRRSRFLCRRLGNSCILLGTSPLPLRLSLSLRSGCGLLSSSGRTVSRLLCRSLLRLCRGFSALAELGTLLALNCLLVKDLINQVLLGHRIRLTDSQFLRYAAELLKAFFV